MASTKFYLDLRGKAADGKGSVLIQIFHNHSMTSVSTGIRLLPAEWDGRRVVRIPGAEAINASLEDRKGKLDKAIAILSIDDKFDRMTAADIKKEIIGGKPRSSCGHLVSDLFAEYIKDGNLKPGTIAIYETTLKKIKAYSGDYLRIEQINYQWLRGFDKHLAEKQCANGRSIFLRSLKAVCNHARKSGIQFQYPFYNFQIRQEPTKKKGVFIEKLREFYSFPVEPYLQRYKDYFFLMFYLIGINTIDLFTAKKSQIVNGRLEYIRAKTGKPYSIKIEPEAEELIRKYSGEGDYLLEVMDHCKFYRSFAHAMNDALKLIGTKTREEIPDPEDLFGASQIIEKVVPIIPGITTNSARHAWATIAQEMDISTDIISRALGHSPTNRTTFIYIKPDQKKIDDANRKIIDNFKRLL